MSDPTTNGHAPSQDIEMGDSADVKQETLYPPQAPSSPSITTAAATADMNASAHTSNPFDPLAPSPSHAAPASATTPQQHPAAPPRNAASTPSATRQSTPGAGAGTNTSAGTGTGTASASASLNSLPPSAIIPPANPHGSATRVYINSRVTPALLEGMKWVAANEPEKPLKWLGEYLLERSREVEGS